MKIATLYMARNKITDDFYIGITSNGLKQRKYEHLKGARKKRINNYFYNAIRKYGEESFIWTKIGSVDSISSGMELESELISELKPQYNTAPGGTGVKVHTIEARKKMSEANKGNKNKLGRKHSEETKKKIAKSLTGHRHSEESILRISLAQMGNSYAKKDKG